MAGNPAHGTEQELLGSGELGQGSPSVPAPLPSSTSALQIAQRGEKSREKRLENGKLGIQPRAKGGRWGWSRQMW